MKVTVTKYLNVRVGEPSVNAPCYQYLAPGSIIEVDDQPVKGDAYDNIDSWYHDQSNNYYWTGGTEEVKTTTTATVAAKAFPLLAASESQLDWYHREYQIPALWEQFKTQGEGVTVAVIDSGIRKTHPCFRNSDITGYNYAGKNEDFADNHGHGSSVAGMICGCGPGLIGIAPRAALYAAKVYDTDVPTPGGIANALRLLPEKIRIVVISNSFMRSFFTADGMTQEELVKIFTDSDRIICCSPGNNSNHAASEPALDKLPAAIGSPTLLSIGAVVAGGGISDKSCKSNAISLAAPGGNVKIVSTLSESNPVVKDEGGTSFSTPFVAGVLSLLLSRSIQVGKPLTNVEAVQLLLGSVKKTSGDRNLFGHGIIDPIKTLSNLK